MKTTKRKLSPAEYKRLIKEGLIKENKSYPAEVYYLKRNSDGKICLCSVLPDRDGKVYAGLPYNARIIARGSPEEIALQVAAVLKQEASGEIDEENERKIKIWAVKMADNFIKNNLMH